MKYSEFIIKYIGKKIDFDGAYGVQCVDLINRYMCDVLGLNISYFPRYAKNFWLDRNKNKFLIKNFTFFSPTAKLQRGDIGVRATGTAGHIFIIDHKSGDKLYIYDQNATGNGDPMTARIISCDSQLITGVLRPKNQKNIDKENKKVVKSKSKLIDSPCKQFKTNAYMTSESYVFSNNTKENITGFVNKNEKVKLLAMGKINSIIQYGVDKEVYKVGIAPTKLIKKL